MNWTAFFAFLAIAGVAVVLAAGLSWIINAGVPAWVAILGLFLLFATVTGLTTK